MTTPKPFKLPIELPSGWSAEVLPVYGTVITARATGGELLGYVTVNEEQRGFELGQSIVRRQRPVAYTGRTWRKDLYAAAVAQLQAVWCS